MNIKKFEARSMKEALEMVKTQLGPDAVILSAKEVSKGFGLGGLKSIEITAAYSELVLKQKNFAQSKMPQHVQDKFNKISAKNQKDVIKKVMNSSMNSNVEKSMQYNTKSPNLNTFKNISERKYIEIDSESLPKYNNTPIQKTENQNLLTEQAKNVWNNMDVQSLKSELENLKKVILEFKNMPQTFIQSHPGAELGIHYNFCQNYQKLITKGLMPNIAAQLILNVQKNLYSQFSNDARKIDSYIAQALLEKVSIKSDLTSQFQLFFGPSGSGKTTTLVKMAAHLTKVENKRIAIVSTDTIKIGADEQMRIYAQLLQIPFISIKKQSDWDKIQPHLNHIDYILVDFASMNLRNEDEMNYLLKMTPQIINQSQSHLVLSAKTKDSDALNFIEKYKALQFDDFIITALDEVQEHGILCNLTMFSDKPLFGFGIGNKIPDDFEWATIERVIDLILDITKKESTLSLSLENNI